MGSVDLHPALKEMAAKAPDNWTLDEAAIVHTMQRSLRSSREAADQIRLWLQQENPLRLRGSDLFKWATEVSEWVLPTQMRNNGEKQTEQDEQDAGSKGTQATTAEDSQSA